MLTKSERLTLLCVLVLVCVVFSIMVFTDWSKLEQDSMQRNLNRYEACVESESCTLSPHEYSHYNRLKNEIR